MILASKNILRKYLFFILFSITLSFAFISPVSALENIFGPVDINELTKRYAKEAAALKSYDYNNYTVNVLKDYGDLGSLAINSKEFSLESGSYRVTSFTQSDFLGQEIKDAPDFVYLKISSEYYLPGADPYTNLKKLEPENIFYISPGGKYDLSLIDLRKIQPEYKEFGDEFTSDDITLRLEKIEIVPTGAVWFIDREIETILGVSAIESYTKTGGTVIKYDDIEEKSRTEKIGDGKEIILDTNLLALSSEELEEEISKLAKLEEINKTEKEVEIALSIIVAVLVILIIIVPFRLNFSLRLKESLKIDVFENFSKVTGLLPIQPIKFVVILGLVFAGIFYVLQLLPIASVATSETNYVKEGDWYKFRNAADFLMFGVPNISKRLNVGGNFISDDPLYVRSVSSAKTFEKNVSLVRVPGVEFDELFKPIAISKNSGYKVYANPNAPSESDFVFDVETLNKRNFIVEEFIQGDDFDGIFTQPPVRFGENNVKVNLEGFNEFGIFISTMEASSLNGTAKIKLEPDAVNAYRPTVDNVGGVAKIYNLNGLLVAEVELVPGETDLSLNFPSGIYYLDVYSFGGRISYVSVNSETSKLAADWRLFGRVRGIFSARCNDENEFVLVDEDWISDHRNVSKCAFDAWTSSENQLTTMFTADIYKVFVDTTVLPTSDIVITNRNTKIPPNENRSVFILYNSSLGDFNFEDKFSLKKIKFDYETK